MFRRFMSLYEQNVAHSTHIDELSAQINEPKPNGWTQNGYSGDEVAYGAGAARGNLDPVPVVVAGVRLLHQRHDVRVLRDTAR